MKKIVYSLLVACLFACNDLDMNPLSQGSSENWYSDEIELTMSVILMTGQTVLTCLRFYQQQLMDSPVK